LNKLIKSDLSLPIIVLLVVKINTFRNVEKKNLSNISTNTKKIHYLKKMERGKEMNYHQSVSSEVDEETIRNRKKTKPPKKQSNLILIFDFIQIYHMPEKLSRNEYKQLNRKPKKKTSEEDKIRKRKKIGSNQSKKIEENDPKYQK
jgi:hypothetical protein